MNADQFVQKVGAPNASAILLARHLNGATGKSEAVMRAEIDGKAGKWIAVCGGHEETIEPGMAAALLNAGAKEVTYSELEEIRHKRMMGDDDQ